jgi:hypothetical protein
MIKELTPLLKTHKISFDIKLKDDHLHITYLPTLLKEDSPNGRQNLTEEDERVLEQPLWGKFPVDEFNEEEFVQKLHDWSNALIEGFTDLAQIKENIKSRVAAKSTKSTAKAKPKRKTKKEQMDEAREKQANERAEQGDLFTDEDEDRLGEKTPVKNKKEIKEEKELKTAAEKAVERVTQKDVSQSAEAEAEEIATAADNKVMPEGASQEQLDAVATKCKEEATVADDDPFGLNDLKTV